MNSLWSFRNNFIRISVFFEEFQLGFFAERGVNDESARE